MSSDLICGYIAGIHFCLLTKETLRNVLGEICCNPLGFYGYYVVYYVYANILTILYADDNSILTLPIANFWY